MEITPFASRRYRSPSCSQNRETSATISLTAARTRDGSAVFSFSRSLLMLASALLAVLVESFPLGHLAAASKSACIRSRSFRHLPNKSDSSGTLAGSASKRFSDPLAIFRSRAVIFVCRPFVAP